MEVLPFLIQGKLSYNIIYTHVNIYPFRDQIANTTVQYCQCSEANSRIYTTPLHDLDMGIDIHTFSVNSGYKLACLE